MNIWEETYVNADRIRQDMGISWREVARRVGCAPSTFSRLKRGSGLSGWVLQGLVNTLFDGRYGRVKRASGKAR